MHSSAKPSSIPLSAYRDFINLSPPKHTSSKLLDSQALREATVLALSHLYKEYDENEIRVTAVPAHQQTELIRALLTVRDVKHGRLPWDVQNAVNGLLSHNLARETVVPVDDLPAAATLFLSGERPSSFEKMVFYRGDITRLGSPRLAIVNACNARLLGCFDPKHMCVDNVIHAAAGPNLRQDCYMIMQKQGHDEPNGEAKITRAWSLPSAYVLHTVGPQLRKGASPTQHEEKELASCYTRSLDLAKELGTIDTVAFPTISTGLFFFPGDIAARIVLRAVNAWLEAHPSTKIRVVFTLFAQTDVDHYQSAIAALFSNLTELPIKIPYFIPTEARKWIREADLLVIRAGAGLSVAAIHKSRGFGLDYTSEEVFASLYPGLLKSTKVRTLYGAMGDNLGDPHVKWAYYLHHVHNLLTWGSTPVYCALHRLASAASSYFVVTTNVDNMFLQSGFTSDKIYTPQGSYTHLQCLHPCSKHTWPVEPYIDAARSLFNPHFTRIPDDRADLIPTCPRCGGPAFLNVRGGAWFVESDDHSKQRLCYETVLRDAKEEGKKVVLLEIGSGWNTPGVIRSPGEIFTREGGGRIKLIRVNERKEDAEVPMDLKVAGDAIRIKMGALEFMEAFDQG